MFKKYEKIPASLHFTLHTVNLKRKMSSYFKLSFQRGNSYHGATDLVKPDEKGILKFEASYDTKCTLYLSKQDATTKPKKLKIILHRFTDQNTSKIYGKIVIDVSKYYGSKSVSYEEFEMESGRSIPPVLGISIIIKQAGQSVVGAIDQSDKSFIDEDTEKIPVNDWDKTEIDNNDVLIQRHTESKKKKKDKKRKTDADSSDSSEKTEKSEKSDVSEKSEDEKEKEEKPKKKKGKKKKEPKPESESEKEEKPKKEKDSQVQKEAAPPAKESKASNATPDSEDTASKKVISVPDISDSDEEKMKEKEEKPKKKKGKKKKEPKPDSDSDSEKEEKPKKEKSSQVQKETTPPPAPKVDESKESESNDNENSDKAEKKKKTKKSKKSKIEKVEETENQSDSQSDEKDQPQSNESKDENSSQVKVRSVSSTPVVVEKTKEDKKGPTELDIEQMITSVIARSWSNNGRQIYLDAKRRVPLPAAVFTIFAVLIHTKFFSTAHVDNKEFSSAMDTFFDEYENAPICDNCTSDQRFITTLCLILLVNKSANELGFAPDRVKKFTSRLLPFMNDYARQIIAPLLINFEVLCNRFSTARFEVDPLLEDFKEVLEGIKSQIMYTNGINEYLLKHFMQLLDVKMLNKLLANPARFVFSKAIIWNSFLTAFLSAEKFELPLLRQAVWTLVMAVNMTSDNEPGDEVRKNLCPTLDPKIIVYLLKNCHEDAMMPTAINWKKVADAVHVEDADSYDPVKPTDINEYEQAGQKLKIQLWNQVQIDNSLLKLYPYLAAYSVASS